ncbi:hypothetical protein AB5I41_12365 [Sphingomonas sp. MMS24-JH45]
MRRWPGEFGDGPHAARPAARRRAGRELVDLHLFPRPRRERRGGGAHVRHRRDDPARAGGAAAPSGRTQRLNLALSSGNSIGIWDRTSRPTA